MEGKLQKEARLGHLADEKTLKTTHQGMEDVETLLRTFLEHETPEVGMAKQLAERMASLARMIHHATLEVLKAESDPRGSRVGEVGGEAATAHGRAAHATTTADATQGPLSGINYFFRLTTIRIAALG